LVATNEEGLRPDTIRPALESVLILLAGEKKEENPAGDSTA